jgi:uncharacterized Ntn-hydrolase superfamily protein
MEEEQVYAQVLQEVESGLRRDGLWAKALASARGNESGARALYIEYRVQSVKDEMMLAKRSQAIEAAAKVREETQKQDEAQEAYSCALSKLGYVVSKSGSGWTIREPLGGRARVTSLEALAEYASAKQKEAKRF